MDMISIIFLCAMSYLLGWLHAKDISLFMPHRALDWCRARFQSRTQGEEFSTGQENEEDVEENVSHEPHTNM